MFFIGIFGVQDRKKKLGEPQGACGACRTENLDLVKTERIFHIFFLPVFHWNRRFYLVCPSCGHWAEIGEERAERLMNGDPVGPWDMPQVPERKERRCTACGHLAQDGDRFCAKCGRELEEE